MAREDENLRGQEVRLERSERTLRQQRPAGRATQWRVILYHRPNSKPCSTSRVFCIMAREDENLRGQEVRLERSERTLRQQRPAGRATQWRVILYHRPNLKPCSTSRVFCIMAREDENLRGQEVRLERSERTLRQQRPAGRATQWRVILYHRPNSKPCSTSRVFCICRPDGAALIRQYWRYCGWRHGRLIRPTGSVSPRRVWRFQPHL